MVTKSNWFTFVCTVLAWTGASNDLLPGKDIKTQQHELEKNLDMLLFRAKHASDSQPVASCDFVTFTGLRF